MKKLLILILVMVSCHLASGQTRTELQVSDLQKPIKEYIHKNYKGYTIGKIFKVDTRGTITYDICINKGDDYQKVFFDKDYKFLKLESCSHDCCQIPAKK